MNRGDLYDVDIPGLGRRPGVIVTRDVAIPFLANVVLVLVTTRVRGLPTEVSLDRVHGLSDPSVANCDNLFTIPKTALVRVRGTLGPAEQRELDEALRLALALD